MRRSQSHSEAAAHALGVVIDIPICGQLMLLQAGVGFVAAKAGRGPRAWGKVAARPRRSFRTHGRLDVRQTGAQSMD